MTTSTCTYVDERRCPVTKRNRVTRDASPLKNRERARQPRRQEEPRDPQHPLGDGGSPGKRATAKPFRGISHVRSGFLKNSGFKKHVQHGNVHEVRARVCVELGCTYQRVSLYRRLHVMLYAHGTR